MLVIATGLISLLQLFIVSLGAASGLESILCKVLVTGTPRKIESCTDRLYTGGVMVKTANIVHSSRKNGQKIVFSQYMSQYPVTKQIYGHTSRLM